MKDKRYISFKEFGYRDVYWCYIVNEPMILTYEHGNRSHPKCELCGWVDTEAVIRVKNINAMIKFGKDWLDRHEFVCHIFKPSIVRANNYTTNNIVTSKS